MKQRAIQLLTSERHRVRRGWLLVAAATLLGGALAFHGLDNHVLWDDEANTALFARNLLATGELTAWDGENLVGFRGGAELDAELVNVYMPPLQYYVAAAGFALLGETTFAARAPFALLGIAAIALTGLLARRLFGERDPFWLPPALLAVTPAYLLYIRNARYYAVGAFFAIALLAVFAGPLERRREQIAAGAIAVAATAGLMLTNYLYAAGALGALPLLFLLPRCRTRRHLLLLGAIGVTAAALAVHVWLNLNPFGSANVRPDDTAPLERLATLASWHLRGLGTFEFVPLLLIPLLALPFVLRRAAPARPLARRALVALGMIAVAVATTVAFTPQSVSRSLIADMRYLVPAIALGTLVTAAALTAAYRTLEPLGVVLAAVAIFSNLPHLGFLGDENGWVEPKGVQCTLCRYVAENAADFETPTEALLEALEPVPAGTEIVIVPTYMAYAPMFYRPDLRYCCQLEDDHPVFEGDEIELPARVSWSGASPEIGFLYYAPPPRREGPLYLFGNHLGTYRVEAAFDGLGFATSRPEIPWHAFDEEERDSRRDRRFLIVSIR